MVKYAQILKSNTSFFSTKAATNLTAVFVGATQGIGLGTLQVFAKHTSSASPSIYIVGRSQKGLDSLAAQISSLNPSAKVIPVRANDLTLVKDAQTAANEITSSADKVDFLFMSPGYITNHRDESPEGLDRVQAIRHYSRMRFLVTLRPLLLKSASPRVVTVLGAGMEGKLWADDLLLKDNYSLLGAASASGSMVTLYLESFAKQPGNDQISLVHTYPGTVGGTGLKVEGLPWFVKPLYWIAVPLINLFGMTIEQAGERTLYAGTSDKFPAKAHAGTSSAAAPGSNGTVGSGVYLVGGDSKPIPGHKTLTGLRSKGLEEKVWDHTNEILEKVERS
ncbi:hypothetical protein EJ04DRAFT_515626 [Polyplosphaeria fusca]|uniref:NAD(P)-binding protein n=1 Tax=Polyplosphaeria fusca TaxID=682080 RepID=A0A9P4QRT0_9PLEO|nr:hypothetical protein EJ04DRAFT_515626 [Polyplosphaeria fusca]